MSEPSLPAPNPDLADIAEALRTRHGCHTAILYGSFARGDATKESDYDVAGFADTPAVRRIAGKWRGSYLDVFIYPDSKLDSPDAQLLHLREGGVLFERDGAGRRFLEGLQEVYARGPEALPADELLARRRWAWKMLDRAARGDAEGDFRRVWLLTALLEDCFHLRRMWFEGPKKSLAWLKINDPALHAAFVTALSPGASLEAIGRLAEAVAGPRTEDGVNEELTARRSPGRG
jgi:predicted nucleotidyltransferase